MIKDFELIERICNVKNLEEYDIDDNLSKYEIKLFKLARLFVSYNEILHFENNMKGAVDFILWLNARLYTRNDCLYTFAQIFKTNNIHQEFVDLYEDFYNKMGGRDMDRDGLYSNVCCQIALRYNFYKNGDLKWD